MKLIVYGGRKRFTVTQFLQTDYWFECKFIATDNFEMFDGDDAANIRLQNNKLIIGDVLEFDLDSPPQNGTECILHMDRDTVRFYCPGQKGQEKSFTSGTQFPLSSEITLSEHVLSFCISNEPKNSIIDHSDVAERN